jgi:two-component system, sensor histidine kinase and response regulator
MPDVPSAHLVIVDDEAAHLTALCDTLRLEGYVTTGFTSPHQALAALPGHPADLLLTDLMMPEMDGIALLRSALEIDPNLAGVIMTGQGAIDTAVESMKSGAIDYITKPFRLSVILPVLARALALRRLRLEKLALEARVLERTAELEAANRELEAFSYSVSHDLLAPLRHIEGYAAMLARELSDSGTPETQRLVKKIRASVGNMGQLIEDILRLSRFSRQPIERRTVHVAALVEEIIQDLRKERPEQALEISIGLLPDCVGDLALLRQVFYNLLANAMKFTRHKIGARLEIGCERHGAESAYVVRDNGAGFDMRYAVKLFGVFQRLHHHDEYEGTGIGLSIVQRIVQRHGGRIWAEGEVGKGATFRFTLGSEPLTKPAA